MIRTQLQVVSETVLTARTVHHDRAVRQGAGVFFAVLPFERGEVGHGGGLLGRVAIRADEMSHGVLERIADVQQHGRPVRGRPRRQHRVELAGVEVRPPVLDDVADGHGSAGAHDLLRRFHLEVGENVPRAAGGGPFPVHAGEGARALRSRLLHRAARPQGGGLHCADVRTQDVGVGPGHRPVDSLGGDQDAAAEPEATTQRPLVGHQGLDRHIGTGGGENIVRKISVVQKDGTVRRSFRRDRPD
mmetsp:Transcript_29665/g.58762  ORF Transcript_29665/g.58762 Transcript_29665/m.58762 type:complete len:245 (-) Transcript_29665:256-990(-)